jgi:hypothetical protein
MIGARVADSLTLEEKNREPQKDTKRYKGMDL